MHPIRRIRRTSPLPVAALLGLALWLQVAQPLLLAGHLATCATDPVCAGACRHPAGEDPVLAAAAEAPAAGEHGHDVSHCVLCRTLQLAGKGLTVDAAPVRGGDLAAGSDLPHGPTAPVAAPILSACGPRAPPSC